MLAARQAATKAAAEGKAGGQQSRVDVAKVGAGLRGSMDSGLLLLVWPLLNVGPIQHASSMRDAAHLYF
jgi:hypothetical protein